MHSHSRDFLCVLEPVGMESDVPSNRNRPFFNKIARLYPWFFFVGVCVCGVLGVIVKSIINKNDIGSYREVVFDFRPKFHNGDKQSP